MAGFFDNYYVQDDQKYYIVLSHEYPKLTKDKKNENQKAGFKIIQSKIDAKSIKLESVPGI